MLNPFSLNMPKVFDFILKEQDSAFSGVTSIYHSGILMYTKLA